MKTVNNIALSLVGKATIFRKLKISTSSIEGEILILELEFVIREEKKILEISSLSPNKTHLQYNQNKNKKEISPNPLLI